jgi:hypothetical protein
MSPPENFAGEWTYSSGVDGALTGAIQLAFAGTLGINYVVHDKPATAVALVHQDGRTDAISPGSKTYTVKVGDRLEWELSSPGNKITLEWSYAP